VNRDEDLGSDKTEVYRVCAPWKPMLPFLEKGHILYVSNPTYAKGTDLVPKNLRRKLGLKPGGKVHMAEDDGRLILTPVPADPIEAATGFLKGKFSLTQDLRREHRNEARRERKARPR